MPPVVNKRSFWQKSMRLGTSAWITVPKTKILLRCIRLIRRGQELPTRTGLKSYIDTIPITLDEAGTVDVLAKSLRHRVRALHHPDRLVQVSRQRGNSERPGSRSGSDQTSSSGERLTITVRPAPAWPTRPVSRLSSQCA